MSAGNCKKCKAEVLFIDRGEEQDGFIDLFCIRCGSREFISTNTPLGIHLMEIDNG